MAGGGPAGVATAVALARLGVGRVLLLDRARFPRAKPCGGGLTGHALDELAALQLALRVPHIACDRGQLVYGSVRRQVALPRPVCVVRREEFDADLLTQARDAGVDAREGEGIARFAVASEAVEIDTTSGRRFQCRVLVGADGAGSLVRRHLVGGARRPLRLSRLELPDTVGLGRTMVYDFTAFDRGLRGYVWLFPVPGGRVNVGVMHSTADLGGRALDRVLADALRPYGVDLPGPARAWPAWGYDPRGAVSGPRLLCVGDAAGIDALTGEGIAVGLAHGRIAAQTIADALTTGNFSFAGYREALRRAPVGRELALDRWLAALLYGTADFRPWLALVMFDRQIQELYAARVSGTETLAERKRTLVAALGRHLFLGTRRMEALGGL